MEFDQKLNEALEHTASREKLELVDLISESQLREIDRPFIPASEVVKALKGNVGYMLAGAHAIGRLTREPRATQDVDVVVDDVEKAKSILIKKFPFLKAVGTRLVNQKGNPMIDILDANHPVYREAFGSAVGIDDFRVPTPEALLVMKFTSSHSPVRNPIKKKQDQIDFLQVAQNSTVDLEKAKALLQKANPELAAINWEEFLAWIKEASHVSI